MMDNPHCDLPFWWFMAMLATWDNPADPWPKRIWVAQYQLETGAPCQGWAARCYRGCA